MWANWPHHPSRLGDLQRFAETIRDGPHVGDQLHHPSRLGYQQRLREGDKTRRGPDTGGLATSPLPSRRSPTLQRGGQKNRKSPHERGLRSSGLLCGGAPTLLGGGQNQKGAHMWADWPHQPCPLGSPTLKRGGQNWPHQPCLLGGPQRFKEGDKITRGPHAGRLATSPLPYGGSPMLQRGEQNQV